MENEKIDKFKWRLNAYLNQDNYELFLDSIKKLDINENNYVYYLELIKEVMKEKIQMQDPFEITNEDRLFEAFGKRQKEKTFLEHLPDLNNEIVNIFKKKLNITNDIKYEDSDIVKSLDDFKERFM